MKHIKWLLACLLIILLTSCGFPSSGVQPIEKYRGKGIIVLEQPKTNYYFPNILVKNKDSVFYIKLSRFDALNLKPGDTL